MWQAVSAARSAGRVPGRGRPCCRSGARRLQRALGGHPAWAEETAWWRAKQQRPLAPAPRRYGRPAGGCSPAGRPAGRLRRVWRPSRGEVGPTVSSGQSGHRHRQYSLNARALRPADAVGQGREQHSAQSGTAERWRRCAWRCHLCPGRQGCRLRHGLGPPCFSREQLTRASMRRASSSNCPASAAYAGTACWGGAVAACGLLPDGFQQPGLLR